MSVILGRLTLLHHPLQSFPLSSRAAPMSHINVGALGALHCTFVKRGGRGGEDCSSQVQLTSAAWASRVAVSLLLNTFLCFLMVLRGGG